jgi:hypothetical protein
MMIIRLLSLLSLSSAILASEVAPAAGTITLVVPTYDYTPGKAENTEGYGIANNGTAVGQYNHNATYGSFTRSQKGRFSRPILFPGADVTDATGINISGLVCGSFDVNVRGMLQDKQGASFPDKPENIIVTHGFFFDGSTYTQFDLPGFDNTYVTGVNDAGDFCGYGSTMEGFHTGFVSIGGVVTTFSGPSGATISPLAINNLDQIVGYYNNPDTAKGFFRDAGGTLTYPIVYPNSQYTTLTGINDAGLIVGWYTSLGLVTSGLVVQNFTLFTTYNHPDATNNLTYFGGVNNNNQINGYYQVDASGSGNHAFIARLGR